MLGMELRSHAVIKNVRTLPRNEESVTGMEQGKRSHQKYAIMVDAPTLKRNAAMKDAPTLLQKIALVVDVVLMGAETQLLHATSLPRGESAGSMEYEGCKILSKHEGPVWQGSDYVGKRILLAMMRFVEKRGKA